MITAQQITAQYDLAVTAVQPLPDSSRAYKITSDQGCFVLRLFAADSAADHAGELAALRFLAQADYPAPRLQTARDGQDLVRLGEHIGYLTTFIPGDPPAATAEAAYQLGCATGRLHALDIQDAGLVDTNFTVAAERQFFERLDADPAVQAWEGYGQIRDQLTAAWQNLLDLDEAPRALLHTDVLFENAVHTPDGAVVLIDWDDAGIGPAVQDIGYTLVELAVSLAGERLPLDKAQAFLSGYIAERRLSPSEWEILPDALVFGAIVYVLAPWDGKVAAGIWRRARYVLDHSEDLRDTLRQRMV